jgi:hypothetical protein
MAFAISSFVLFLKVINSSFSSIYIPYWFLLYIFGAAEQKIIFLIPESFNNFIIFLDVLPLTIESSMRIAVLSLTISLITANFLLIFCSILSLFSIIKVLFIYLFLIIHS